MKTNSVKAHFRELDGIRGLLSFVILLFHLGLNPLVGRLTFGWIPEGRYELAVDFFFKPLPDPIPLKIQSPISQRRHRRGNFYVAGSKD